MFKLVLRASFAGGLPWFAGHECRAGFLSMISQLDSELAARLHKGLRLTAGEKLKVNVKGLYSKLSRLRLRF